MQTNSNNMRNSTKCTLFAKIIYTDNAAAVAIVACPEGKEYPVTRMMSETGLMCSTIILAKEKATAAAPTQRK